MTTLQKKVESYKRLFLTDDGQLNEDAKIVFEDLKMFCKVDNSSFNPMIEQAIYINEGRREVYNRQMAYINFKPTEDNNDRSSTSNSANNSGSNNSTDIFNTGY